MSDTHFTLNRFERPPVTLPLLSANDRIELADLLHKDRKAKLFENLKLTGYTSGNALKVLNDFDAQRILDQEVVDWVLTPRGQWQYIRLARRKESPDGFDKWFDELGLHSVEIQQLAAGVGSLKLVPKTEGQTKENPLSESTIPDGEPKPT